MRNFLLGQRTKYTDAAKKAAEFDDTTDPDYMMYVDEMQSVNNSFTNLASQLGSYKKGKLEYAQTMQEGLYSNGNPCCNLKKLLLYMDLLMKQKMEEATERLMLLSNTKRWEYSF